jgi:hypothetical protein
MVLATTVAFFKYWQSFQKKWKKFFLKIAKRLTNDTRNKEKKNIALVYPLTKL